jgi:Tol biopolymer transport system component
VIGKNDDPPVAQAVSGTWSVCLAGPARIIAAGDQGSSDWPCFSPDGGSVLFAHSMDRHTWVLMHAPVAGEAAKPVNGAHMPASATRPSWSSTAGLIAFTGTTGGRDQVWVMRPDGTEAHAITVLGLSDQIYYPSWYPDGRHLVAMDGKDFAIRRFSLEGGPAVAMTDSMQVFAGKPSVSPDGQWIAFAGQKNQGQSYDQTQNVIWLLGPGGRCKTLEANPLQGRAPVWSPDGVHLAFQSNRGNPYGLYAIFIISRDGTNLTQITPYRFHATHAAWSPNGKHMAMAIRDGGNSRIAVADLPSLP